MADAKPAKKTAAKKTAASQPDATAADEPLGPGAGADDPSERGATVSRWEFIEVAPTADDVLALLQEVPEWYGVEVTDFVEYVQALPQRKKIEVVSTRPDNRGTYSETKYLDAWTLYMTVAGRQAMLQAAAESEGWQVDFVPEPHTPTGIPGLLQHGDGRIVYREYVIIRMWDENRSCWESLGSRPGTAWVPYAGGSAAAGSNPYEKVETSARGRALGAWGIGILPGSGIASVEEMQSIQANASAMANGQPQTDQRVRPAGQQTKPKQDLIADALTAAEELRQVRGLDEDAMRDRLVSFLRERLGIASVYDEEAREIDWAKVKPGQIQLLVNSLVDGKRQALNEQADL